MNEYRLHLPEGVRRALFAATDGVSRIAATPFGTPVPGVGAVYLQLADGRWLSVHADQRDLEARFEVFPIGALVEPSKPRAALEAAICLQPPVLVTELETEDWLDPTAPCGPTWGTHPVAQFQGLPGTASDSASARCNYVSGVRLDGSSGVSVVVATMAFPYSVYCRVFPEGATRGDGPHVQPSAA